MTRGTLRVSGGRVLNVTAVAATFDEARALSREARRRDRFRGQAVPAGHRLAGSGAALSARPSATVSGGMPELPEVETIVRDLRPALIGRRIVRASLSHDDVLRGMTGRRLSSGSRAPRSATSPGGPSTR